MVSAQVFLLHLVLFTFATFSFCQLVVLQFRQRRLRQPAWGGWIWRALNANFAVYFGLLLWDYVRYIFTDGRPGPYSLLNRSAFLTVSAIMPPLLAHVFYATEHHRFAAPRLWRGFVAAVYAVDIAAVATGIWGLANEALAGPKFRIRVWTVVDWTLALTVLFVISAAWFSRSDENAFQRRLRLWLTGLGLIVLVHFVVKIVWWPPWMDRSLKLLPLIFVFVTTYYAERLACFDIFIKRGAFFCLAVPAGTLWFAVTVPSLSLSRMRFAAAWTGALTLLPLLAAAPWCYSRLSSWLDRVWFGRRFSSREAARYFLDSVQGAALEGEFLRRAERALSFIFTTDARIDAAGPHAADALAAQAGGLTLHLAPRKEGVPFLSEDAALLDAMAERVAFLIENLRGQQREQRLRLDAAEAQLKTLRAQINPHFLFNALSAIAGLITQAPDRAEQTVEQLAEVFRYALRRSDREWARLEEEMDFVRAYLDVEQARFGERLTTRVEMEDGVRGVRIPAMVIGTLAENAIKHGIAAVRGPGHVSVTACRRRDRVTITVEDNGPGFSRSFRMDELPPSQSGGYGLRNVRDRLAAHFGGRGAIRFERNGGVTLVSIEIPMAVEEVKAV